MMCLGATTLMQWASATPVRLVLMSATTPPTRVMPSQSARNSGRFGIIRQTVSPFFESLCERPARIAVRARGELAVAEALAVGEQRRRVAEPVGELLDHHAERRGSGCLAIGVVILQGAQRAPETGRVGRQPLDHPIAGPATGPMAGPVRAVTATYRPPAERNAMIAGSISSILQRIMTAQAASSCPVSAGADCGDGRRSGVHAPIALNSVSTAVAHSESGQLVRLPYTGQRTVNGRAAEGNQRIVEERRAVRLVRGMRHRERRRTGSAPPADRGRG